MVAFEKVLENNYNFRGAVEKKRLFTAGIELVQAYRHNARVVLLFCFNLAHARHNGRSGRDAKRNK